MPDSTTQEVAEQLRASAFARSGAEVTEATDPVADTPMIVTLDQLRPYDLNPRLTRNPRYEDIKSSIRERGLDSPPPITRRPGAPHFIIRNGGNTRLSILRELWAETKDEKFFKIASLFRPWPERGEIVALTGHLAENELHGELSFIERALGVEKARELYQTESGGALTQSELARRLSADGYPITQSHISRMQDAVQYLLPAIPTVLYEGLGKHQIERLTALRKAATRAWEHYARPKPIDDFHALFQDVLARFDSEPASFNVQRVQDEIVGQLAAILSLDYDALALFIVDAEARNSALNREPLFHVKPLSGEATTLAPSPVWKATPPNRESHHRPEPPAQHAAPGQAHQPERQRDVSPLTPAAARAMPPLTQDESDRHIKQHLKNHIVSAAQTTERLQSLQRTIAQATGDELPDFQRNVLQAVPVQAGGLYPISDVWYIAPALDAPELLRAHIAQLALEIAEEATVAHRIEAVDEGVGFVCKTVALPSQEILPSFIARAVVTLLSALSSGYLPMRRAAVDSVRLADDLAPLLQGAAPFRRSTHTARLSDAGIVKLFRLIRLARRLLELESAEPVNETVSDS